jgi:nitroimidazol reductase NimA-like FMN-containing flavoprotein (pyridoxamine 5'-phosphate oxidase superfamily)
MRRHEKEITAIGELEQVLWQGRVCHLAIPDDPMPYLIPLNYGYQDDALYFHSAPQGRKIELLKKQRRACFSITIDYGIIEAERACSWGARFTCVMGSGRIEFVENMEQKQAALHILMAQYTDQIFSFEPAQIDATLVFKLVIESMSGKQSRG